MHPTTNEMRNHLLNPLACGVHNRFNHNLRYQKGCEKKLYMFQYY